MWMRCERSSRISLALAPTLLLIAISTTSCSRKTEKLSVPREVADMATQYLECSARADVACAARLFHYPADETVEERAADVNAVVHSLSIITKHFGTNGAVAPANDTVVYVEVAAGGADLEYWQAHPESLRATYRTEFSKFGRGFIAVEMCHISGRWEIRSVHYGLPAANPRSAARVMEVFNEIKQSHPQPLPPASM
jgi:hypothetical protein